MNEHCTVNSSILKALAHQIEICQQNHRYTTIFCLPAIKSSHQVRSALPLPLPPLANPALSLEIWTATTTMNLNLVMTAAENVLIR